MYNLNLYKVQCFPLGRGSIPPTKSGVEVYSCINRCCLLSQTDNQTLKLMLLTDCFSPLICLLSAGEDENHSVTQSSKISCSIVSLAVVSVVLLMLKTKKAMEVSLFMLIHQLVQ